MNTSIKAIALATTALLIAALLLLGASAVWADTTYYYVAADGNLEAQSAATPNEAMVTADDIAFNSGVITAEAYQALSGDATVTTADTATEAMTGADDSQSNSGVTEADAYLTLANQSVVEANGFNSDAYLYVTANGTLAAKTADTASEAISYADDIAFNSGVITAEAYLNLAK